MQHELTVEIAASPERVWSILMDVERWSEWSRSVTSAELLDDNGPLAVGSRVRIKQPRLAKATWQVTDLTPDRCFDSVSRSPGVTTKATHEVDPADDGTSTVRLTIEQTGPLSGLIGFAFGNLTRSYVQMEADGLRLRAESQPG